MDSFGAHWTDAARAAAEVLNLELLLVPAGLPAALNMLTILRMLLFMPQLGRSATGLTGELQPLDTDVNGPVRQQSRKLWKEDRLNDPNLVPRFKDGLRHLVSCLRKVKPETIRHAFERLVSI
jgi:hypothetical protein